MARKVGYTYKKMNNLRSRLTIQIAAIAVIVIAVFCTMYFDLLSIYYTKNSRQELIHAANAISEYDLQGVDYYSELAQLEAGHSFYVEIYDDSDELIYTSRINDSMLEQTGDTQGESEPESDELKPRIMRILGQRILGQENTDDGSFFEVRQEYYGTARYLVYGTFFENGYSVVIYDSLDVIEGNTKIVERFFVWFSVFFLFIMIITIYIYMHSFITPMTRISRVTRNIARLDFSETCPNYRIREMDELSTNINYLSSALSCALADLQEKNYELERDIKKKRELEQMRREFISNASHELKTPIAIIQGYAEGIKVGINDRESSEEYCDVIINEADKMNSLVVRMLEVSRIEAGFEPRNEKFNISEMIIGQIKGFTPLFNEAGVEVRVDVENNLYGCGEAALLDSVVGNYLSNAIGHTCGRRVISVSAIRVDKSYRISVFNTGKPIDENDLDKIWISFYRVDKARSREKGHFGLGLSFVSSVQQAHKQKYGVLNRDDGVEFWFDILAADSQDGI